MTNTEIKVLEDFLTQSFEKGVISRELRLSAAETEFLTNKYPGARLKRIVTKEYPDGKVWYEVKL